MAYNINGLANKSIFPNFFNYIKNCDIFFLYETHLTAEGQSRFQKFFDGWELRWVDAERRATKEEQVEEHCMGTK